MQQPTEQPTPKKRRLNLNWAGLRQVLLVVALMLVVISAVAVIRHYVSDPNTGETKAVPDPAPTTVAKPSLTNLQQLRAAFGPWTQVNGDAAVTQVPFLVLLRESGAAEVSGASVEFHQQDWTEGQPFLLRTVAVTDSSVTISTAGGKLFTIGVEQPFVFEQDPSRVNIITSDGKVWQASSQSVKSMQH